MKRICCLPLLLAGFCAAPAQAGSDGLHMAYLSAQFGNGEAVRKQMGHVMQLMAAFKQANTPLRLPQEK